MKRSVSGASALAEIIFDIGIWAPSIRPFMTFAFDKPSSLIAVLRKTDFLLSDSTIVTLVF